MRAFSCLVAVAAFVGVALSSPIGVVTPKRRSDLVIRDPQVDPPWFNWPGDIACATTWPQDGGQGPPFTWHISPGVLQSVGGFTHAHVFKGCDCWFWDRLNGEGPPRVKASSDGRSTDWWGDLHFRAFAIQCTPLGWHGAALNRLSTENHADSI